jgi:hypothetical protein
MRFERGPDKFSVLKALENYMKRLMVMLLAAVVLTSACSVTRKQLDRENVQTVESPANLQSDLTASTGPSNQTGSTDEPPAAQMTQPPVEQTAANTSVPIITPGTTPEAVRMPAKIEPYPDAPNCTGHDETRWHGLWNAEAGCHYDHTHNADPFATEFAARVAAWDQSISYPWQTPDENALKHEGYKYAYNVDPDCLTRLNEADNCLRASLIQLHAIGSQMGITTRFHSYRAVVMISEGIDDEPGYIELGGRSDFGILHCPYKKEYCPLSSDPPNSDFDLMWPHPPYRASTSLDRLARDLANGKITQAWNSGWQPVVSQFYPTPYNLLFEYDFQSVDAWGAVNADDPMELGLVCPEGDCLFNHSTLRVYEIVVRVPEELAGSDGRVNYTGFTDVQGNIDESCTEIGPDCVPLIIENAPAGVATFGLPVTNIPLTAFPDYDVYFDGLISGWIQYPN